MNILYEIIDFLLLLIKFVIKQIFRKGLIALINSNHYLKYKSLFLKKIFVLRMSI